MKIIRLIIEQDIVKVISAISVMIECLLNKLAFGRWSFKVFDGPKSFIIRLKIVNMKISKMKTWRNRVYKYIVYKINLIINWFIVINIMFGN